MPTGINLPKPKIELFSDCLASSDEHNDREVHR